ncbi:MAG: hypothetical protein HXS52_12850 [Theionarchaea archaeon]|nr:hypothetical protein [Theionarchaea archaeon]MBU7038813.1 hypothetical protein [Theionarchaea archaeon]
MEDTGKVLSSLSHWLSSNPSVTSVYIKKPLPSLRKGFSDLDFYFVTENFQDITFYRGIGNLYRELSCLQGEVPAKKLVEHPPFCLPRASFDQFCRMHPWYVSKWQLLFGEELRETSPDSSAEKTAAQKLLVAHAFHGDDAANICVLAPHFIHGSPKGTQKVNRQVCKIAYDNPTSFLSELGRSMSDDRVGDRVREVSSNEYRGEQSQEFYVDLLLFWCSAWKSLFGHSTCPSEPVRRRNPPSAFSDFCQSHTHLLTGVQSVLHTTLPYDDVRIVFFIIDPSQESALKDTLCSLASHFFAAFEQRAYAKFICEEHLAGYCTVWPWELKTVRETCSVAFGDGSLLDRLPAPQPEALKTQAQNDFFPYHFTSPLVGFEYLNPNKKLALMRSYQYSLFGRCLGKYLLLKNLLPLSPSDMVTLLAERDPSSARLFGNLYQLYQNISPHSLLQYQETWSLLFPSVHRMFQEFNLV